MSAHNDVRLVSKVIRDRDISPLLERGIDSTWISDPTAQRTLRYIEHHYRTYAEVPSPDVVEDVLPEANILDVDDTVQYLLDRLVADRKYADLLDALIDARQKLTDNLTDQAIEGLQSELARLVDIGSARSHDVDVSSFAAVNERLDRYEQEPPENGLLGITTGFHMLDRLTLGWQKQQLITVIATPKAGKSTLALYFAKVANDAGYKVMFVSFEMSREEQEYRLDGMLGGIDPNIIRSRELSKSQRRNLYEGMERFVDRHPFLVTTDISAMTTVSGIAAKLEKHKPDLLVIDGVYLMRDEILHEEGSPQALTNITRNLKRMTQRYNIPTIQSTQSLKSKMKRGRLDADSIGYSSSFFQDSDSIIGLQEIDDQPDLRELRLVASRNAGRRKTEIIWDWSNASFRQMVDDDEGEAW